MVYTSTYIRIYIRRVLYLLLYVNVNTAYRLAEYKSALHSTTYKVCTNHTDGEVNQNHAQIVLGRTYILTYYVRIDDVVDQEEGGERKEIYCL